MVEQFTVKTDDRNVDELLMMWKTVFGEIFYVEKVLFYLKIHSIFNSLLKKCGKNCLLIFSGDWLTMWKSEGNFEAKFFC